MVLPGSRTTKRRKETCVLLAGGSGRRLHRITRGRNKHLLTIEEAPALGHVLDTIVATDSVEKLVVVTRPDSQGEVEALVAPAREQIDVVVRVQSRPVGTLDAVMTAQADIAHDSFGVHYGDNLFAWHRLPALGTALPDGASACLYATPPPSDWRRFAAVTTEPRSDGALIATDLVEKPMWDEPPVAIHSLTGFFRFDSSAFQRVAPHVQISSRGEFELTDVVRAMLAAGQVHAISVKLPWTDFGTEPGLVDAVSVVEARRLDRV